MFEKQFVKKKLMAKDLQICSRCVQLSCGYGGVMSPIVSLGQCHDGAPGAKGLRKSFNFSFVQT